MEDNRSGRYTTAAIVIGGIIGTFIFSRFRKNKVRAGIGKKLQRTTERNLLTPDKITFGIAWSVIYLGIGILAIHQALPSQQYNFRYKKAQIWLRANFILAGVFGYFFSKSDKNSRIGSAVTTMSMLPAAIGLHRALEIGQTEVPEPENTLRKFISMYTGWLTAASTISATTLILEAGYLKKTKQIKEYTINALPAVSAVGAIISKRLNDPYYLITLIAALAGIAVKQKENQKDVSAMAASMAMVLIGEFGNVILFEKGKGQVFRPNLTMKPEKELVVGQRVQKALSSILL